VRCQHAWPAVDASVSTARQCGNFARAWRACGLSKSPHGAQRDCTVEIGYCKDHGGDERAGKEMIEHHAKVHLNGEKTGT